MTCTENTEYKRLHIVVRADLSPGMMLAQAVHAAQDFTRAHPNADTGDTVVVLSARDVEHLADLVTQARLIEHEVKPFYEPDMNGELTAAAFGSSAKRLLNKLPLAPKKPSRTSAPKKGIAGDESDCTECTKCGMCLDHGDCSLLGCDRRIQETLADLPIDTFCPTPVLGDAPIPIADPIT